jgi:Domain of unknown function (DUF3883)
MPLVLVHNDVVANPQHVWDDVEGVQYHYPAKYQSKIKTGETFVYYRGVHRVGGKRGAAEYVGAGRVGKIWLDPSAGAGARRAFYCAIEEYRRFAIPVPAKADGVMLEQIPAERQNLWRDGVRVLDALTYDRIMRQAEPIGSLVALVAPLSEVSIADSNDLILPAAMIKAGSGNSGFGNYRKSKRAKEVGDWAEGVAVRYIRERLAGCSDCVHRAAIDETPGWDIDYVDVDGVLQRVEVKGTIAAAFTGIDLTANEMRAADTHGSNYWLYLVAGCLTASPKIQAIQNPVARLTAGEWNATPAVFSLKFAPT